ncbi:MAG: hypothetical protein M5U28_10980 [Sandaracinaceae bacterium]|nr:hypothetical protein [Sandaracinaceae bacterium]
MEAAGLRRMRAARSARGYMLAISQASDRWLHPRVVFVPLAGDRVDPWGTVLDPSRPLAWSFGFVDVVDEGLGFLAAWPTTIDLAERAGVRAQRFDGLSRPVGGPFWISGEEDHRLVYDVGLLPAPGATVVRWMREPGAGLPQQLCTTRVSHGGAAAPVRCRDLVGVVHGTHPPPEWMAASAAGWIAVWFDETSARRSEGFASRRRAARTMTSCSRRPSRAAS